MRHFSMLVFAALLVLSHFYNNFYKLLKILELDWYGVLEWQDGPHGPQKNR